MCKWNIYGIILFQDSKLQSANSEIICICILNIRDIQKKHFLFINMVNYENKLLNVKTNAIYVSWLILLHSCFNTGYK